MKTSNFIFLVIIYLFAILSLVCVISIDYVILSIPLIIVMNILAYQMVLRKYKKHPNLRVEDNMNDMIMLYVCKTGGCLCISLFLCCVFFLMGEFFTSGSIRGLFIFLGIIIFDFTPSVKNGVRTIQERYIYKNTNKKNYKRISERKQNF